ncbi:hypothetical protein LCGC14_1178250 [marine sediment metagenome]|uniref:Uncharacterized protein n=1 Tax=marine sediment metagenome TaxID=412755 RepID=A0A0F9P5U8_9ZZZZ
MGSDFDVLSDPADYLSLFALDKMTKILSSEKSFPSFL